jgi:RNA polymerase sigma factor (sigma-70 family)
METKSASALSEMLKMPDEKLIPLVAKDSRAFDAIMLHNEKKVKEEIHYIVKSQLDEESLRQDFWTKVWNVFRNNQYCEEGSFPAWLSCTLKHFALDKLKRVKKFFRSYDEVPEVIEQYGAADSTVAAYETMDRYESVKRCCIKSRRQRRMLDMYLVQGNTPREIAKLEHLGLKKVKEILKKGKALLRKYYSSSRRKLKRRKK